jgi:hypothetical protein
MFNVDYQKLQQMAHESLNKIRTKNQEAQNKEKIIEENLKSFDYSKRMFEEFDEEQFKNKLSLDLHFYNKFLSNCNEVVTPHIQQELGKYIQLIKEIYEHINVKPRTVLGKDITMNMNDNEIEGKVKELIHEHLQRNYYSLSRSEIEKKYKNAIINESCELCTEENLSPKDSVEVVTKTLLFENMLHSINFPLSVQGRIVDLLNSESYGKFFDQDKLTELWDDFKIQNKAIARIFGSLV